MEDFLKRIKIIDSWTVTLPLSKTEFVKRLTEITEIASLKSFSIAYEAFSSSNKEFVGQVEYDGFKLRRRLRFFDTKPNSAIAKGIFSENKDQVTIKTEINGFRTIFYFFYAFMMLFYTIGIFVIIYSQNTIELIAYPFLILHASLMFFLPYFAMRRSVKRLKYDLEREFFYLTRKE